MRIPFTLRVEPSATLLYSRLTHAYQRVAPAEAFLLAASVDMPVDDAVTVLAAQAGLQAAEDARAVLLAWGALDENGHFRGRIVEHLDAPRGAWAAPLVAHLGVTLACNFACAHCYSSSGKRAPDELSLDEIEHLTDQLHAMGCAKLVLGGGEPFIRKELGAIVQAADARGIDAYIHTNASLIKREILDELIACPPAGLAVSMDGPDGSVNDAIRGEGAFEKTAKGLRLLRAHYAPGFNISMTVTPSNARFSDGMVAMAFEAGARTLLLRPAYPAGEAASVENLWCDRDTFAQAIDRAREKARALGMSLDAPHPYEQGIPDFDGFGCVASRVVLGITPTGDVTPCLNLPGEFVAGNVRTSSLIDLWRRGNGFQRVRDVEGNAQCDSCRHHDTCRGGCRVRALHVGNGLDGPDAWCHYEPKDGVAPVPFHKAPSRLRVMA